jgi:hypothetical protein
MAQVDSPKDEGSHFLEVCLLYRGVGYTDCLSQTVNTEAPSGTGGVAGGQMFKISTVPGSV